MDKKDPNDRMQMPKLIGSLIRSIVNEAGILAGYNGNGGTKGSVMKSREKKKPDK